MKNNVKHDSYLLVPLEFQDQYGEAIYDDCYNGYGRIGRYDVYELVAIWNRQWLPKETTVMKKPVLEDFEGIKKSLGSQDYLTQKWKHWIMKSEVDRITELCPDIKETCRCWKTLNPDVLMEI